MNKLAIPIVILLLAGYMTTYAQGSSRGGFGIKGGMNFTTVGFNYEDAAEHKNRFRIGGTGGIGYEAAAPGFFAFEIEALYDLRGTKEEATLLNNNELVQKNYLHYIQFPASFKFYIGDNFNLHFGPYGSVLAGGKAKLTVTNPNGEVVESRDFKLTGEDAEDIDGDDFLRKGDFGLHAGLEFISDGGIGIGSRFSKGIVDITHDDHALGNNYATTTEISLYAIFRLK